MTFILVFLNRIATKLGNVLPTRYRYSFLLSLHCLAFRRPFLEIFGKLLLRYREPFFFENLALREGDVFIDVGSHIGQYCLLGAKYVGKDGVVIAIEPHPTNFLFLQKNIKANRIKNVVALEIAISDTDSCIYMYVNPESTVGHSVVSHGEWAKLSVESRRLDSLVKDLNLERIDLIKIDVEGAEFEVLKSAEQVLKHFRPRLLVEVHRLPNKVHREILEYLDRLGYVSLTRRHYDEILLFSSPTPA